jgi:hypothetical protein
MPRPDNLAVEGPAQSVLSPVASTTISEPTDHEWVLSKFVNFRGHVRGLVAQEPALLEWSLWLDKLPISVFLAGGDCELRGVREASTDNKRAEEAGLVLERWALQYDFQLSRIFESDRKKLHRYIELFSVA